MSIEVLIAAWFLTGIATALTVTIGAYFEGHDTTLGNVAVMAGWSLFGPVFLFVLGCFFIGAMLEDVHWNRVIIRGRRPSPEPQKRT